MIIAPRNPNLRRTLSLHAPATDASQRLQQLAEFLSADPEAASTDLVQLIQNRIAELLGKPAAILLPTGKMAQQIALRLHAENSSRHAFAAHPTTHLANWEKNGYAVVHGLRFHALGDANRLFTEQQLRLVSEPLAAVLWELPQREIGGQLPEWDELVAQVGYARSRGAAPHLDGARLWEAQTYYDRPHAEIAELFDTAYVSLYKSLGAPRGAVLAGPSEFIDQARLWSVRLGGESSGNWPLAAFGLHGLAEVLPAMPAHAERARQFAAAINDTRAARTVPEVPQTPLFHVYLPISAEAAVRAQDQIVTDSGVQFFGYVRTTPEADRCYFEVTVGRPAMELTPDEVAGGIARLVETARQEQGTKS